MILRYIATLTDSNGTVLRLSSNTGDLVVSSLRCCSRYSYRVVARNSVGEGRVSQDFSFVTFGQDEGKLKMQDKTNFYLISFLADSIPVLGNIVRSSPTAAVFDVIGISNRIVEIAYYTNVDNSFQEVS